MIYSLFLADMDNTLFDFHAGEREIMQKLFESIGVAVSTENLDLYKKINLKWWEALEKKQTTIEKLRVGRFADFLEAVGKDSAKANSMNDFFVEQLGLSTHLIAGAPELCEAVSKCMPVYFVTNGIAGVQKSRVANSILKKYVNGLSISEEVGAAKPDPAVIYDAIQQANKLGSNKYAVKDCIFLGDRPTADMVAANRAGVDSILFTNGQKLEFNGRSYNHKEILTELPELQRPTYVVHTLDEATKLILQ